MKSQWTKKDEIRYGKEKVEGWRVHEKEAKKQFKENQVDPHGHLPWNSPARSSAREKKERDNIAAHKLSKKYSATWTKKEMNTNWAGNPIKRTSKTSALNKAKK